MDEISLIILAIVVILSFPVIAIVALVKAVGARESIRQLQQRVAALEAGVSRPPQAAAIVMPPPAPAAEETMASIELPPALPQEPTEPPLAAPPAAPPPLPAAAAPAPPPASLEERFGTQWVVWIGGLALALGAIFLVRYSIEQGLIGPGVRIFLGGCLAALLIAAGEWTRRNEIKAGFAAVPTHQIPSILTAAGTVAAYATVYAAYALYGFLSPATAFILLGIVALATLAAALLHGPALAGLGLVGAFITPLLVTTEEPSYWALYVYLAVVTAAAFALARMRLWRWLAITAVVFGAAWTLPGIAYPHVDALGAHLFHAVVGFALAAALIVSGLFYGPSAEPGRIDEISSGAIGAYLLAATFIVVGSAHDTAALTVFTLLTAATVAIAWRSDAALSALPAAGVMTAFVMLQWVAPQFVESLIMPAGVTHGAIPEPPTGIAPHLALGAVLAVLFGLSGFFAQGRAEDARIPIIWSATATATPIAILVALYARIANYDRSVPFALLALALAALYGYATELLGRRDPRPGIAASGAIFATGAIGSLALMLTFGLEKGWLTVGLALMVPGIAWVAEKRPLPALRYLAAATVALVLARIAYEPRIVGNELGTTPIFNWLLYGYGVPAASFWYAGFLLRRRADDAPARVTDAAAILFTVLLAVLEIRHFITNGNVYAPSAELTELGLQVSVGLAITIGLERLRLRSHSVVHDIGALVVGGLTLAVIVLGLCLISNPFFESTVTGGPFFNLILLGYGIPALLAGVLALVARANRPLAYRYIAATAAIVLALLYLTLEVRRLYQGSAISPLAPIGDAEQYTYSVVWLTFGVVLLAAGLLLRSQPARIASAAVIALTIGKAFLIDMAGLTGIFRALSFIGLGVVLVGIGWLYQRLLFPSRAQAITPNAAEAGKSDE
jgi:uncharacterized membrane protein